MLKFNLDRLNMFGLQRAVDKKSIFITGEKIEPNVLKQKLGREKSIWKKKNVGNGRGKYSERRKE